MNQITNPALQSFNSNVGIKFQLYNSLFTSLPFQRIEKTGVMLSLLLDSCEEGFRNNLSPNEIIDNFFEKHITYKTEKEKLSLLFLFIQYAERQVVLFDAVEDAAFNEIHDDNEPGTMRHLTSQVVENKKQSQLAEKLKDFSIRLVLTAHPTQFYPDTVLGIMTDLSKALRENNAGLINTYLQQLGKTAFLKKQKPTPLDEAMNLLWYLENIFYPAAGRITSFIKSQFPKAIDDSKSIINMGFWPGGDRDGNPFVNTGITLQVAEALRGSILKCYYLEIRRLKRRLTFKGIDVILVELEKELYDNVFIPGAKTEINKKRLLTELNKIKEIIINEHDGLFLHLVQNLINKVHIFGMHFASLDIRQESSVHTRLMQVLSSKGKIVPKEYIQWNDDKKIAFLTENKKTLPKEDYGDVLIQDTLDSIKAIRTIQKQNGEEGCNRYVISQCNSVLNVLEVFGLCVLCGWDPDDIKVDIIPLFETIDDLENAMDIMRSLYSNPVYRKHVQKRNNTQTIMLGFSDGTKDGGYLMANFGIYKAREALTAISKEFNVDVVFFDGRGGPPARGGGKTHNFYASMGKNISNKQIQLTIQGQTVSSNFGTIESAQYNMEQLLHAGIYSSILASNEQTFSKEEETLIRSLSEAGYKSYISLKHHPLFVDYLSDVSPLTYYSEANIGSRPSSRAKKEKLNLKDLRAIPFVGAWTQMKQNVPGYFGVGSALRELEKQGKFDYVKALYQNSLFFKTLLDNCEMAMKKCFFPLTQFLSKEEKYAEIWNIIYDEYQLTKEYIFKLTGKELMSDFPVDQMSVVMRERMVLPLLTIQQFAITRIRKIKESKKNDPLLETLRKLVIRCSFGIINAGRNSV